MATSSSDSVFGVTTAVYRVSPGITLAQLVAGDQIAGVNSVILKNFSGGTMWIIGGVASGSTLTPAQLASAFSSAYLVSASETLNIDGPARFYLGATGATAIAYVIYGAR